MDLQLQGAKAFVAASRSGLGAATARQLSLEGAHVVINGRDAETLRATAEAIQTESGNPVIALATDISNRQGAYDAVSQAANQLGGLDILVTNAGGPPHGTFESLDMDAWDTAYELLMASLVQMIHAALPHLEKSERAAILAITSVSVKQPVNGLLLSNTMRAGLAGLIKTLANEYGPSGIRVNAILPGWTATARVGELLQARAEMNGTTIELERAQRVRSIPLGRLGSTAEFGNAAAFLCSPVAGFIHGAMIPVDGGEIKATM